MKASKNKRNKKDWRKRPFWYYGIPWVVLVDNGDWSDPEVYYKRHICNETIVSDWLWDNYLEDCREEGREPKDADSNEFTRYMKDNAYKVKEIILEYGEKSESKIRLAYPRYGEYCPRTLEKGEDMSVGVENKFGWFVG